MGNSEEKHLPYKGLSDLNFSSFVLTCVRSAIYHCHEPASAGFFMDVLNRTIYRNVERMNSDKNLTLVIANYAGGQLSVSGQHVTLN